jgi:hypothetical protein
MGFKLPLKLTITRLDEPAGGGQYLAENEPASVHYAIHDADGQEVVKDGHFNTALHNVEEVCGYTLDRIQNQMMTDKSVTVAMPDEVQKKLAAMRAPKDQVLSPVGIGPEKRSQ